MANLSIILLIVMHSRISFSEANTISEENQSSNIVVCKRFLTSRTLLSHHFIIAAACNCKRHKYLACDQRRSVVFCGPGGEVPVPVAAPSKLTVEYFFLLTFFVVLFCCVLAVCCLSRASRAMAILSLCFQCGYAVLVYRRR